MQEKLIVDYIGRAACNKLSLETENITLKDIKDINLLAKSIELLIYNETNLTEEKHLKITHEAINRKTKKIDKYHKLSLIITLLKCIIKSSEKIIEQDKITYQELDDIKLFFRAIKKLQKSISEE